MFLLLLFEPYAHINCVLVGCGFVFSEFRDIINIKLKEWVLSLFGCLMVENFLTFSFPEKRKIPFGGYSV